MSKAQGDDQIKLANALLPAHVILHIGMTKAGSTAAQNALEKNYDFLLGKGILFPRSIFSRRNPHFQGGTSGHLELIRDLKWNELQGFIDELERTRGKAGRVVISAENIFLDVEDEHLDSLARLLENKKVEILAILRSQLDWSVSRYYQSIVRGNKREHRSFEVFVDSLIADGQFDYHGRLKFLANKFGADKVVVLDYDRVRKKPGGTVGAVLSVLGLDESLPLQVSESESNIGSPYPERIEAHRRLNVAAGELRREDYLAWCGDMEAMASELKKQRGLEMRHIKPGRESRRRIAEACLESNRRLSAEFFSGEFFGLAADAPEGEPAIPAEPIVGELVNRGLELLAPYIRRSCGQDLDDLIRYTRQMEKRYMRSPVARASVLLGFIVAKIKALTGRTSSRQTRERPRLLALKDKKE
jgi:hypothetical protein